MSRIEDIRVRLDRYWSDDTAAFVAHAPSDVEDLLAVAEAAEEVLAQWDIAEIDDSADVLYALDAVFARLDAS